MTEDAALGLSLALDDDFDLVVEATKAALPDAGTTLLSSTESSVIPTAFKVIEGVEEVGQALRLRLATRLGEDRVSQDYGLPKAQMVGLFDPDFTAAAFRTCILQDPRVLDVPDVEVGYHDDTDRANRVVTVRCEVNLRDGTSFNFAEVFAF